MNNPLPQPNIALETAAFPLISVVILNYNGLDWLPRCFASIEQQTVFSKIEVIVVDNASTDGSAKYSEAWVKKIQRGRFIQNQTNLFFCGGNNVGAAAATGEFLLFLNFDLWLEPDCLEKFYHEIIKAGADCGAPFVMNYDDNSFQGCGASGLDLFGLPTQMAEPDRTREIFVAYGCSLLIRRELFQKIGAFPEEFLMYDEETDVCWRVWIAGGKVITVYPARLHHRGAALANPAGKTKMAEARTNETKRYLANRNGILLLLKHSQHFFLLLLIPRLGLLLTEALVGLLIIRRWGFIKKSYLDAIGDAFRMLPEVRAWRRRIRGFRQRGDFGMLRFLRLMPSRWTELKRIFKFGAPKIDVK